MMIGGGDLIIPARPTELVKAAVLRRLTAAWPLGVIEKDPTEPGDFFFYRDAAAKEAWDDWGGIDENQDTMIHVLYGEAAITLVTAMWRGETKRIANAIADEVRRMSADTATAS